LPEVKVDDITGLYNRRGFQMLAEQHMHLVKRGAPISLLVCARDDGLIAPRRAPLSKLRAAHIIRA
jgi:hypothetical protein